MIQKIYRLYGSGIIYIQTNNLTTTPNTKHRAKPSPLEFPPSFETQRAGLTCPFPQVKHCYLLHMLVGWFQSFPSRRIYVYIYTRYIKYNLWYDIWIHMICYTFYMMHCTLQSNFGITMFLFEEMLMEHVYFHVVESLRYWSTNKYEKQLGIQIVDIG